MKPISKIAASVSPSATLAVNALAKKLIPAKKERRIRKPMNLSADAQEAAGAG